MSVAFSRSFPHRDQIRRAARVKVIIGQMQAQGIPLPPALAREAQQYDSIYSSLSPFERDLVAQTFQGDVQNVIASHQQNVEEIRAADTQQRTDTLVRELTKNLAGRPEGMTAEIAAALRAGDKVHLRTRKLPTGAEADARVRAHTGQSLKQYESKLDAALEARNMTFYNRPEEYAAFIAKNFPGQDFKQVDRVVRNWAVEGAGLELQRRAQKDAPNTMTVRADEETQRRLALIESIAEVEAGNPRSPFAASQRDRLVEISRERGDRTDDLRASIAEAFLANGADGFEVDAGPIRDDASDEVVGVEDDNG
jgi:hypothetical protein